MYSWMCSWMYSWLHAQAIGQRLSATLGLRCLTRLNHRPSRHSGHKGSGLHHRQAWKKRRRDWSDYGRD
jgi:hypothetical protein